LPILTKASQNSEVGSPEEIFPKSAAISPPNEGIVRADSRNDWASNLCFTLFILVCFPFCFALDFWCFCPWEVR